MCKGKWRWGRRFGIATLCAAWGSVAGCGTSPANSGQQEVVILTQVAGLSEVQPLRVQLPLGDTLFDGTLTVRSVASGLVGDLLVVVSDAAGDTLAEAAATIELPPGARADDHWAGQTSHLVSPGNNVVVVLPLTAAGRLPPSDLTLQPALSFAPDIVAVVFQDPAQVSSEVEIFVLAHDRDGPDEALQVAVQVNAGPPVPLDLASTSVVGALFSGQFTTPTVEGEYELHIAVQDLDGSRTEETKISFAQDNAVWCTARCSVTSGSPPRERVVAQQTRRTSRDFCTTWCSRFCFGPQGNGATIVDCSY